MRKTTVIGPRLYRIVFILITAAGLALPRSSYSQSRFMMQDSRVVAVLDFEQDNIIGGEKLGAYAADELTTALFINRKLKVIDRTLVKSKTIEKNVSPSAMTADGIHDLASALNADFLILGQITRQDAAGTDPLNSEKIHMGITLRILSGKDGSVVGMVTKSVSKKGRMQEIVANALRQMAEEVKFDAE
jgi:curli biogenesis system outer membrane secretion channel CsgG